MIRNIEYQKEAQKPKLPTVALKNIPNGTVFSGRILNYHYPHRLFMKVSTFAEQFELEKGMPESFMIALDNQNSYGADMWDSPEIAIENYRPVNIKIQVLDTAPDF